MLKKPRNLGKKEKRKLDSIKWKVEKRKWIRRWVNEIGDMRIELMWRRRIEKKGLLGGEIEGSQIEKKKKKKNFSRAILLLFCLFVYYNL